MPDFQKIEIPRGNFIGWGVNPGQKVTLRVVSYDPAGGTDFNGNRCPEVVGTLTEDCDNYRDKGTTKERVKAGELVTITGGLDNVRKGLLAADPKPGDFLQLDYYDKVQLPNGNEVKNIDVYYAKGSANGEDDGL